MKNLILITAMILTTVSIIAQQEAVYTHYTWNTLAVNPAYAGSRQAFTVTALHRSQWVGFDGAPVTQSLTMHTPILNDVMGLGLSVVNDKIGPIKNTSIHADLAYRLTVNDRKDKLVFGVKGGFSVLSGNLTDIITRDEGDMEFVSNVRSNWQPNFGFGAYYHAEKWYAGLSVPTVLESKYDSEDSQVLTSITKARHYYAIAGSVIDISRRLQLKPTTMVRVSESAPMSVDLTAEALIDKHFSLGMMYRSENAIGILLGYQFSSNLGVGYSFDWSTTSGTGRYNAGSHELVLRYDVEGHKKRPVISPRYF